MQAITTKYLAPTESKGARLKAECEAKSITVPYDHSLNTEENRAAAARSLSDSLGWSDTPRYGKLASGMMKSGQYAHVFVD